MRPHRGAFGREEAAHLARRAAFQPGPGETEALERLGLEAAVESLLVGSAQPAPQPEADALERDLRSSSDADALAGAWIFRLGVTTEPLRERMALFWHGHFTSAIHKVGSGRMMLQQVALFRHHALGGFPELARAVSRDPAMVRYLDLERTRLSRPNENFARELMELFTIGRSAYSERDVREASRAFTGYEIRHGLFRFSGAAHDAGTKTVLDRTGALTGDDVVDLCASHPATARRMARALARTFVCDRPSAALVEELAATWRREDGSLRAILRELLRSEAFYAPRHRFALTRSPVVLAVALLRLLRVRPPLEALARRVRLMGQALLDPPTVKGYEGGTAWLNPASWLARRSFALEAVDLATRQGSLSHLLPAGGGARSPAELYLRVFGEEPAPGEDRALSSALGAAAGGDGGRLLSFILCHPRFQSC